MNAQTLLIALCAALIIAAPATARTESTTELTGETCDSGIGQIAKVTTNGYYEDIDCEGAPTCQGGVGYVGSTDREEAKLFTAITHRGNMRFFSTGSAPSPVITTPGVVLEHGMKEHDNRFFPQYFDTDIAEGEHLFTVTYYYCDYTGEEPVEAEVPEFSTVAGITMLVGLAGLAVIKRQ